MIRIIGNIIRPFKLKNIKNFYYSFFRYGSIKLFLCNDFSVKNKTGSHIRYFWKQKTNFPHPIGIVIGRDVILGKNVTIYQNVTLGKTKTGYPKIEDNVTIYPNSIIIGGVTIGEGAVIPPLSIVRTNVKSGEIYTSPES